MTMKRMYKEERPPPTAIGFRVQVSSLILHSEPCQIKSSLFFFKQQTHSFTKDNQP
jgi:hypothetical protein